jgi:succinate dehydrogenase / fumarate reductase membrane anchor subunit
MTTTLRPTPSPNHAQIRTPLARVRGLGSAKEGTDHFWRQRVTAVANLILVVFAVFLVLRLVGSDYGEARALLASPVSTVALSMLILSGVIHMRLGMQTVIEDYIHTEGLKFALLMLNTFFAIAVGATCILAVLKLAFGV